MRMRHQKCQLGTRQQINDLGNEALAFQMTQQTKKVIVTFLQNVNNPETEWLSSVKAKNGCDDSASPPSMVEGKHGIRRS